MNHCFEICHYQQNVPQHYYLLDTLVHIVNVTNVINLHSEESHKASVLLNVSYSLITTHLVFIST